MGMENYLISSSLIGIMAQRLVRVICPECKEPYTPEVGVMEELGISHDEVKKLDIFKGRGCKNCANTGFRGRKGIYELLMMNDDIRELILDKTPSNVIKEKGRSQGMKTLREAGWQKVKAGISTVSEVVRVTQVE
jgi:type II secretory ATPase GspE/PulE/Tfp pilus assembly ATPase PilB-like protein